MFKIHVHVKMNMKESGEQNIWKTTLFGIHKWYFYSKAMITLRNYITLLFYAYLRESIFMTLGYVRIDYYRPSVQKICWRKNLKLRFFSSLYLPLYWLCFKAKKQFKKRCNKIIIWAYDEQQQCTLWFVLWMTRVMHLLIFTKDDRDINSETTDPRAISTFQYSYMIINHIKGKCIRMYRF